MDIHSGEFIFRGYRGTVTDGRYDFYYRIKRGETVLDFTDTLLFPPSDKEIPQQLLTSLLDSLLLMFGISYWKLYCPKTLVVESVTLSKEQATFWNTVYTKGLGEFFYKNNIDFRNLIQFPVSGRTSSEPVSFERKDRSLLMVGGGKDSIVSWKFLDRMQYPATAMSLNTHVIQKEVIKTMNIDSIAVQHKIDEKLLALSNQRKALNGHIPISALYAFISLFASIIYDYRYVISSNERSANIGNVTYLGEEINHQWSKSIEFEQLFQNYVREYITPSVTYFSLLRPLTEVAITKKFATLEEYFFLFSSCNRNFTLRGTIVPNRWCGQCPKCLTVFLLLAPFIEKEQLLAIFGKNLFEDKTHIPIFEELLGLRGSKPFECVATFEESQWAMQMIINKKQYDKDAVIQYFKKKMTLTELQMQNIEKEIFSISNMSLIPEAFKTIYSEYETR